MQYYVVSARMLVSIKEMVQHRSKIQALTGLKEHVEVTYKVKLTCVASVFLPLVKSHPKKRVPQ